MKQTIKVPDTVFVYNASGQLVAEYSNQISQTPIVSYLTSDHLGSPRITTDADGDVYTRRDFMPFGEEIDVNDTPERTATLNYASDEIRQKFTSYERDNETDLDFAQARMYGYELGRFTSPDPLLSSGIIENPQTWNRYIYVLGNPLMYTDPLGLYAWDDSAGGSASDADLLERSQNESLSKTQRRVARRQWKFRKAFQSGLEKAQNNKTGANQEAVDAYGAYNQNDNLKVGVNLDTEGNFSKDNAETKSNYVNIAVVFDYKNSTDGMNFNEKKGTATATNGDTFNSFVVAVTHEGSHANDFQNWIDNKGTPNASQFDITHYESERLAYTAGSYMAQSLGMDVYHTNENINPKTWKKGWTETDRKEAISKFVNASYSGNNKPLTEENYGWKMSNRKLDELR